VYRHRDPRLRCADPAFDLQEWPGPVKAQIIDGSGIAKAIFEHVREGVEEAFPHDKPGLAALTVGGENASTMVFLSSQKKAAAQVGIDFKEVPLPPDVSEKDALASIHALNRDEGVHGIIIQRPLPDHLDGNRMIQELNPVKDVEGMHPWNLGEVVYGRPRFVPCTAAAAIRLFRTTGLCPRGLDVVVVGHSEIVGKPISLLLVHELATTTLCHIGTRDLKAHTRRADVLFVAAGVPGLIRGDGVKPGACVIDIGINRVLDPEGPGTVYKIVGDVQFEEVSEVAGFLTPVPGGVGPVTTAILMENTLRAAMG
jgi:methylenetetrahydrofolate dehydrogenase (NADP+)/methenyltetrahydrofolate cyclohydrolase